MKKVKSIFTLILMVLTIVVFTVPVSNSYAASNQLIIINSKYNTLNYYKNNILVSKFRCATGKYSTPTPQRKTTIVKKIKNRPFYKRGIPGGDPRNPLGKRWMGLNMYGYGTTYGIHGTNDESSIGKHISHGCIRMHNKDVEWLYDQITIGANVIIKYTSNSDSWIAKQYGIKLKTSDSSSDNDEVICTKYTKSSVSLRTGASTSYRKICTIPKNSKVSVIKYTTSKKWAKVKYNGYTGWVSSSYLNDNQSSISDYTSGKTTCRVRLRKSPSKSSSTITIIPKYAKVKVYSKSNGWAKVSYNGRIGYCYSKYIK